MLTPILTALTAAIRRYLQLDPHTTTRLRTLAGKVVKMELIGWNIHFYLLPDETGIRLLRDYTGEVDATVRGSPLSLLRMSFARDEKKVQLANSLEITGDVELAQTLSHIIQQCQVDWEEPLSHVTGDVVAHQLGNIVRRARRWFGEVTPNLSQNMTEYLQEEIQLVPPRQEVEDFFSGVHSLRDHVERLAARVERIQSFSPAPLD